VTAGYWRHALVNHLIGSMPAFIMEPIWKKAGLKRINWMSEQQKNEKP
jgi:hypothetical protein